MPSRAWATSPTAPGPLGQCRGDGNTSCRLCGEVSRETQLQPRKHAPGPSLRERGVKFLSQAEQRGSGGPGGRSVVNLVAGGVTKMLCFSLWEVKIASRNPRPVTQTISPLSDPFFSDTCKIDTKFLSLNYLGGYVEPQASKGCVLSGPDKDQEVHIVELQAPNSSR